MEHLLDRCGDYYCRNPFTKLYRCVDCDTSYCDECWSFQGPHKSGKTGRDGIPHEKVDPAIADRLSRIFSPPTDLDVTNQLHQQNRWTKWFDVIRDNTGQPILRDFDRLTTALNIKGGKKSGTDGEEFPQLVSFVGVTSSGKSALVKMLIDGRGPTPTDLECLFPSPVVGSPTYDSLPTSSDVHLYADPATHSSKLPILYADCEGFDGGEKLPMSHLRQVPSQYTSMDDLVQSRCRTRSIMWAAAEDSYQRESVVARLHPRLLHTFSDCVVFVLDNPRTFETSVLTKLLDWGNAAMEQTMDQPALPQCIVVLNNCTPRLDEAEWNVEVSTKRFIAGTDAALHYIEGVARFRQLAERLRSFGRHIKTIEDIISCYYSSFRVIRMPIKPNYMLMSRQLESLYSTIRECCKDSFDMKRRACVSATTTELEAYFQSGFQHFSESIDLPFSLLQASLVGNSISTDLSKHLARACSSFSRSLSHDPQKLRSMFDELSVALASAILLDCARLGRKCQPYQIFAIYETSLHTAFKDWLSLYCVCSYASRDGKRRCNRVQARHPARGHRDEHGIIGPGTFAATMEPDFTQELCRMVRYAIEDVLCRLARGQKRGVDLTILEVHLQNLNSLVRLVGSATSIQSHLTCLLCFMSHGREALPCGHVLCKSCMQQLGERDNWTLTLSCCPLHPAETLWESPHVVRIKPPGVGVCVLTLDSGGIRGTIQLEVLRAIEQAIGRHMRVQDFFDLIVGSGSGGLIALKLATDDGTVDICSEMFGPLCNHAYHARSKSARAVHSVTRGRTTWRRENTRALHEALKHIFSSEAELFGSKGQPPLQHKAAVLSDEGSKQRTILHANYSRPDRYDLAYSLDRRHEPCEELKIWQATAATMANPSHFKAIRSCNRTYSASSQSTASIAMQEVRQIWPDVVEPRCLLSLGTGQSYRSVSGCTTRFSCTDGATRPSTENNRRNKNLDVPEAENAWRYVMKEDENKSTIESACQFIRIDPDLGLGRDLPAMNDYLELKALRNRVRCKLQDQEYQNTIEFVVRHLVASQFFLEVSARFGPTRNTTTFGRIACRRGDDPDRVRALAMILDKRRLLGCDPYFELLLDEHGKQHRIRRTLTGRKLSEMIENGCFDQPEFEFPAAQCAVSVHLCFSAHTSQEREAFRIAGITPLLSSPTKNISTKCASSSGAENVPLEAYSGLPTSPLSSESTDIHGQRTDVDPEDTFGFAMGDPRHIQLCDTRHGSSEHYVEELLHNMRQETKEQDRWSSDPQAGRVQSSLLPMPESFDHSTQRLGELPASPSSAQTKLEIAQALDEKGYEVLRHLFNVTSPH